MRRAPYKGHVLRMRLRLHYTWLVAFIFIIVVVATQFPEAYSMWRRLLLGLVTGLLFLAMILIRQFALNLLALSRDVPLRKVTLYVFGGVPGISKEVTDPLLEILLGVSGLLFSLMVTGLFYLVYILLVIEGSTIMGGLVSWLTVIFLMLSFFHFIPGFPLDGGRILRGILWRATGNYDRATRITSYIGEGVGFSCIIGGLAMLILTQEWFLGVTLAFVGWVLYGAAAQINRTVKLRKILRNLTVSDVMSRECPLVSQQLSVRQLVRDYIIAKGQPYLVVVDNTGLLGSVNLRNIKSVSKKLWDSKLVAEIMTPANRTVTAYINQSTAEVLEQMMEMEIDLMPVVDGEKVVGVITRDALITLARIRGELGV